MAVTKTHPIKSTLKAAIDYILNPEKTDGKLLASSFGCGLETADIEFAWTREAAGDRGTHLGRHLIQSFAVGETTPEEAHKIGMELAGAVLGGKYEFVLTTHVDKDHLHNHLIFNAVSFVDYKKYHSNKQSYHFIRRTSDRICKEHGLSVVVPGQDKGKSYAEYTAEKQGTSYKAKLKTAIDTLIPQVKDFDELLRRLQEMGYEIKQGKYISFRAAGQERFTRTKTLGAAYTEEAINNVFFLNGKAGIHAIKPPNPFYALSVYLSAAAPPVSCIRPASSKWTVFSAAVPVSRLLPLLQGR